MLSGAVVDRFAGGFNFIACAESPLKLLSFLPMAFMMLYIYQTMAPSRLWTIGFYTIYPDFVISLKKGY
jgi:hypothetical protein